MESNMKQPTLRQRPLIKDWRHWILNEPTVLTEDGWRTRNALAEKRYPHIYDLMGFAEDHLIDILIDVDCDEKPPAYFPVGASGSPRPLAWLPKRSHLEWHLFRGIDPSGRRPSISPTLRALVIERDGLVCGICGGAVDPSDVHLDHIKPFSKGGPTTFGNLRVTHSVCNMRKGAKV